VINFLAVFLGGGLGSVTRYALGLAIKKMGFMAPLATLTSNVFASALLLGLLATYTTQSGDALKSNPWLLLWTVGFCGAFSTFSTFAADTISLLHSHGALWSIGNIAINVISCIAIGWWIWSAMQAVN
jgi:CrcB protein